VVAAKITLKSLFFENVNFSGKKPKKKKSPQVGTITRYRQILIIIYYNIKDISRLGIVFIVNGLILIYFFSFGTRIRQARGLF